jgi:hypothetical protein
VPLSVAVQPPAQARVGRWVAGVGAPQIQPRLREVLGGASFVRYTPDLGVVIVRGPRPHAAREHVEFVSGDRVDQGYGVHTQQLTTDEVQGELA